ncbi:MAG: hypothetical protein O2816_10220 [Planctomycetota bacterium]|nr:hypothetical protein [Planctomycetota bacterium]
MWTRVIALLRAQLAGEWYAESGSRLPIAPILFQVTISGVLCGIAGDVLPPYPYAIFALTVPLGLGALALFGELAPLLRSDAAAEWVGALPIRPIELRLARVLVTFVLLGGLALGALLPAVAFAPGAMLWPARIGLLGIGLLQTLGLAAFLLLLQVLCARRAEGVLVLLHTLVFVAVLVGFAAGLSKLGSLAEVTEPTGVLLALPSTWYAALLPGGPGGLALTLGLVALGVTAVVLAVAPFPPPPRAQRTGSPLSLLLEPLRRLAARTWVRPRERATFEFVWDALPAERDFVSRAYPLLAVPVAFLLLGADGGSEQGEGLLAIALFAPAIYLPVLLMHVPATGTPEAHWLIDLAPVTRADQDAGARKAIALRFLLPLFLALSVMAYARADLIFALRLAPAAFAATLLLQRVIWPGYVSRPPLSAPPSDLGTVWDDAGSGGMLMIAIGTSLVAILAWRKIDSPWLAFAMLAVALLIELAPSHRKANRGPKTDSMDESAA